MGLSLFLLCIWGPFVSALVALWSLRSNLNYSIWGLKKRFKLLKRPHRYQHMIDKQEKKQHQASPGHDSQFDIVAGLHFQAFLTGISL